MEDETALPIGIRRELTRLRAIEETVRVAMRCNDKGYMTPENVRTWFVRLEVAKGFRHIILKQLLEENDNQ